MALTQGQILKYTILPGFIPRIFALATSGFGTLTFYMAIVYNIAKLIPDGHPYLNRYNIGKFGIRHVIAAAADNLVFKWKNIDQIIIFFTLLGGIGLIFVQLLLFLMALIAGQTAFAGSGPGPITTPGSLGLGITVNDMFNNPSTHGADTGARGPEQDIAFIILDRVFGLQGMYDSCVATGTPCENNAGLPITTSAAAAYPYPFHEALHLMLRYYSMGIVFVAALMFIYFVTTTIAETAQTGTPFGQRFNRAWTPVRFVLFFAMILPLNIGDDNAGLNGAQLITFWVAKQGSNFATNGWVFFNNEISQEALSRYTPGDHQRIIATPNAPELGSLIQFIFTVKTCAIAESIITDNPETTEIDNLIVPYIVRPTPASYSSATGSNAIEFLSTDYDAAVNFSQGADIKVRFGHLGEDTAGSGTVEEFAEYSGNVKPFCGEMTFSVADPNNSEPVVQSISEFYYLYIRDNLWPHTIMNQYAECVVLEELDVGTNKSTLCNSYELTQGFIDFFDETYKMHIDNAITAAINEQIASGDFVIPEEVIEKGWAGAAIWYNRIAKMNGAAVTAIASIPRPGKYPLAMEFVQKERILHDATTSGVSRFDPILPDGTSINLIEERDKRIYKAIFKAYSHFGEGGATETIQTKQTGNVFIDTVNLILGTSGLFEMRKNADIHPLAQLSAIGRGMMEATVRNAAIAGAGIVGGGIAGIVDPLPKQIAGIGSSFLLTVVYAAIGIAVILYYVLPFLPFIYFLFAVSGWVKSIFEAIVAIPLWALAHIRIDGEGIPGQDASNGYFLLLEIFLRPILILFGLLASINIFAALVDVLNNVFDLVVGNVAGFDVRLENESAGTGTIPTAADNYRKPIDEFFFTAMYAIICYLIGISCFKLIDLIPNNILRWAGTNVATFQENAGDPAGQLTSSVYRGSVLVSNQIQGTTQGNLQALIK